MSRRVVLVGAVHESLPALRAILDHANADLVCVVTLTARAASKVSGVVDLTSEASGHGIDVVRVDDVNDPDAVDQISRYEPDLIVVVGWTRLVREKLLSLPSRGCVGFHASLLPKHRGRAPVNWSIINGETETGNTMMMLSPGVDTGDIVDQLATPIYLDDTCGSVYERVADLGAIMLADRLDELLAGTATLLPQSDHGSGLLPKRVPEMGVIDWERPPVDVHNWIRALTHPYPGAFTTYRGNTIFVWSSEPLVRTSVVGRPGEVLSISDAGVRVGARGGSLVLTQMTGAHQPAVHSASWAEHVGLRVGDQFDQPDPAVAKWSRGAGPGPVITPQRS